MIDELKKGYRLKSVSLGNSDMISIFHQGTTKGHIRLLTDHVDVKCIIFDQVTEDHLIPLGGSFIRFLIDIEPRKFIFFVNVSEVLKDVLKKTLLDTKNYLIRENHFMLRTASNLPDKNGISSTIEFQSIVCEEQLWEVLELLKSNAYWQHSLTIEGLTLLLQSSQCFMAIQNNTVIAFARVLTDRDTFASLWDVVVEKKYRGIGVGYALMHHIFSCTTFSTIRYWALFTESAKNLYTKFGFTPINEVIFKPCSSCYIVLL